ncbi:hypothetical protein A4A49_25048 [Nicotiana attenuata]|uniref:Uncharacterized protein n=1 Tax=Nicotiana attenuata TaxID=49451 RepID=A0A1J6KD20_NICAT|nr:hypothetical protein A4A49_25048 [Nicotiana attenuata]
MKNIAAFGIFLIFLILSMDTLCLRGESRILELDLSPVKFNENMSHVRGRSNRQLFKPNPSPMANSRKHQIGSSPPPIMK